MYLYPKIATMIRAKFYIKYQITMIRAQGAGHYLDVITTLSAHATNEHTKSTICTTGEIKVNHKFMETPIQKIINKNSN